VSGVRYRVTHRTVYEYSQPVSVCHSLFHLRPRATPTQRSIVSTLAVDPPPAVLIGRDDVYGNPTTFGIVQQIHRALAVEAVSEVELGAAPAVDVGATPAWEQVRDALRAGRDADTLACYSLVFDSPMVRGTEKLRDYAAPSFAPGRPILEAALELSSRIHANLTYEPGATTVGTTPDETLALGRGVCQDFAHLMIGCLRSLGLAARYVSGYLVTSRGADAKATDLVGGDASHAWLGVWTRERGWVDLDPTNDQMPTDRHVTVAWGRDYGDVAPVRGVVLGGGEHGVRVGVEVAPVGSAESSAGIRPPG
jgi:transglutaminase-like putative cysteine protease